MTVAAPDTLSNSKVYQTKSTITGLLSRFIKQYQELQSYKYVLRHVWHWVAINLRVKQL